MRRRGGCGDHQGAGEGGGGACEGGSPRGGAMRVGGGGGVSEGEAPPAPFRCRSRSGRGAGGAGAGEARAARAARPSRSEMVGMRWAAVARARSSGGTGQQIMTGSPTPEIPQFRYPRPTVADAVGRTGDPERAPRRRSARRDRTPPHFTMATILAPGADVAADPREVAADGAGVHLDPGAAGGVGNGGGRGVACMGRRRWRRGGGTLTRKVPGPRMRGSEGRNGRVR